MVVTSDGVTAAYVAPGSPRSWAFRSACFRGTAAWHAAACARRGWSTCPAGHRLQAAVRAPQRHGRDAGLGGVRPRRAGERDGTTDSRALTAPAVPSSNAAGVSAPRTCVRCRTRRVDASNGSRRCIVQRLSRARDRRATTDASTRATGRSPSPQLISSTSDSASSASIHTTHARDRVGPPRLGMAADERMDRSSASRGSSVATAQRRMPRCCGAVVLQRRWSCGRRSSGSRSQASYIEQKLVSPPSGGTSSA